MTNRKLLGAAAVAVLLVALAVWSGGGGSAVESEITTATVGAEQDAFDASITEDPAPAPAGEQTPTRFSDLPGVSPNELPDEALETLALIGSGGPYPFGRDDLVFQNREGLLPDRTLGHYREYTVITPGEDDRGARRIVAGADGELYYTADHYSSFAEVIFDG